MPLLFQAPFNFYPRSPCGERRWQATVAWPSGYFYPRSPCGERRDVGYRNAMRDAISIHALLAESDTVGVIKVAVGQHFYPRSPCGERPAVLGVLAARPNISIHALLAESDFPMPCTKLITRLFLSTLSLRRATVAEGDEIPLTKIFLSTLSLRRATRNEQISAPCGQAFYPRSPCGERPFAHRFFLCL